MSFQPTDFELTDRVVTVLQHTVDTSKYEPEDYTPVDVNVDVALMDIIANDTQYSEFRYMYRVVANDLYDPRVYHVGGVGMWYCAVYNESAGSVMYPVDHEQYVQLEQHELLLRPFVEKLEDWIHQEERGLKKYRYFVTNEDGSSFGCNVFEIPRHLNDVRKKQETQLCVDEMDAVNRYRQQQMGGVQKQPNGDTFSPTNDKYTYVVKVIYQWLEPVSMQYGMQSDGGSLHHSMISKSHGGTYDESASDTDMEDNAKTNCIDPLLLFGSDSEDSDTEGTDTSVTPVHHLLSI